MRRIAKELAKQMNQANIVPGQEHRHPAYIESMDSLRYAINNDGKPVLGESACSIDRYFEEWVVWDDFGASGTRIVYNKNKWVAGDTV